MRKELTVTLHIGGREVETLTDEECERMAQLLSETMSKYYSLHSAEFSKLNNKG